MKLISYTCTPNSYCTHVHQTYIVYMLLSVHIALFLDWPEKELHLHNMILLPLPLSWGEFLVNNLTLNFHTSATIFISAFTERSDEICVREVGVSDIRETSTLKSVGNDDLSSVYSVRRSMLLSMQGRCCRCLWLMPHRCNNRHHNPISTIFHHTFFPPLIFICLSSIFSLLHFLSYHIFNENHKSQSHDYRERVAVKVNNIFLCVVETKSIK